MAYLSRLSVIKLQDKLWIKGNVLRRKPSKSSGNTILSHALKTLGSYWNIPLKNTAFSLKIGNREFNLKTDEKGSFSNLVPAQQSKQFELYLNDKKLNVDQDYPTYFDGTLQQVEVISDIDDTVLISHTSSALKRISNILFILPQNRKTVVYTYRLMQAFMKKGFRISYLSKSESNLFELIKVFIDYNHLPKGPLLLTPHLRWNQLLAPNKGRDYKLNHIKLMLKEMPAKKFILLGDDSQRDMEIYTEVIKEFKDRILKVFIRQSGFVRSDRQEQLWQDLLSTGVDAIYFNDSEESEKEIEKINQL